MMAPEVVSGGRGNVARGRGSSPAGRVSTRGSSVATTLCEHCKSSSPVSNDGIGCD